MKTVNEIVFSDSKYKTARSVEDLKLFTEAFTKTLSETDDVVIHGIFSSLKNSNIKNFGDVSALELLGSVALFLTQIPDNVVDSVIKQREIRHQNMY